MPETKFTPGPWELVKFRDFASASRVVSIILDERGRKYRRNVARCDSGTLPNHENARLIAAAPDLLESLQIEHALHMRGFTKGTAKSLGPEALKAFLIGGVPGLNNWRRQKREKAIAKALGERATTK